MEGLFFLAMIIGVGWLAIWSCLPRPSRPGGWWPFEMAPGDEGPGAEQSITAPEAAANERALGDTPLGHRPWRAAAAAAAAATDIQYPLSQRGASKPWDIRREPAAAPRHPL